MIDFEIRGKCKGCKKNKWFIRQREVMTPLGLKATSHDLMCNTCFKRLKEALYEQKEN